MTIEIASEASGSAQNLHPRVGHGGWAMDGDAIANSLSNSVHSCVDWYRVGRRLGSGGGGEVFEAVDTRTGGLVAVKLLPSSRASEPDRSEALLREARIVDHLRHSGVVEVVEYGRDQSGRAYLSMELLRGESLDRRLARGPLPTAEAVSILRAVLEALKVVHAAGVLHRDLKPGNVFLAQAAAGSLLVKLIDFGLAAPMGESVARGSRVSGTPAYMAPERLQGHPGSEESDLYAVGVIAYEMLTGHTPFGEEPERIVNAPRRALAWADPSQPSLSRLIARLLASRRLLRPRSATALLRQLRQVSAASQSRAPRKVLRGGVWEALLAVW